MSAAFRMCSVDSMRYTIVWCCGSPALSPHPLQRKKRIGPTGNAGSPSAAVRSHAARLRRLTIRFLLQTGFSEGVAGGYLFLTAGPPLLTGEGGCL